VTADNPSSPDWDRSTRELYARLIESWDKRNARDYALLFASEGNLVGFDGSQVNGQLEVGAHLTEISRIIRLLVTYRSCVDVKLVAPTSAFCERTPGSCARQGRHRSSAQCSAIDGRGPEGW